MAELTLREGVAVPVEHTRGGAVSLWRLAAPALTSRGEGRSGSSAIAVALHLSRSHSWYPGTTLPRGGLGLVVGFGGGGATSCHDRACAVPRFMAGPVPGGSHLLPGKLPPDATPPSAVPGS